MKDRDVRSALALADTGSQARAFEHVRENEARRDQADNEKQFDFEEVMPGVLH